MYLSKIRFEKTTNCVKILGAGPAGLSAAIVLAQAGFAVVVFERNNDVGGRFNNDYQGLENWSNEEDVIEDIRRVGLKEGIFCRPIYSGVIYNSELKRLEVRSETPIFYLLKRGNGSDTIDSALKQQAIATGVEIRFGERKRPEEVDVVATGPRIARVVACGMTFQTDLPDQMHGIFNNELAPRGYAYLLVADGQATLSTILYKEFDKAKGCLMQSVNAFRKLIGRFDVIAPKIWGGFGSFGIPKTAIKNGRLYVGEAAGFQDFLFGFGIRYAVISGYLAAKSFIEGTDYDKLWKAQLLPRMKASQSNRMLFEIFGDAASWFIWKATGTSKNPSRVMQRIYDWSLPRRLIYPITAMR